MMLQEGFAYGIKGENDTNTYGYVRVSSTDQNEDRQMQAMQEKSVLKKTSMWTSNPARILTVLSIKRWLEK